MRSLEESIKQQPPPPCVDCEYFDLCATESLACQQFFYYILSRSKRLYVRQPNDIPSRKMYNACFPVNDCEQIYNTLKRKGSLLYNNN